MKKVVRISYDIEPGMPVFTNNPANRVEAVDSFEKGATWNSYHITLFNHNGTHIDAPKHFDCQGKVICDYKIGDFIYEKPCLVDLNKEAGEPVTVEDIKNAKVTCDLLMIRTGFWKKRKERDYIDDNPWLSPEAAGYIRSKFKKLKAIAVDTISIASFQHLETGGKAHQIMLKKGKYPSDPVLIIEDVNLGLLPKDFERVFAVPLFIKEVDSMPCTVFVEASSR